MGGIYYENVWGTRALGIFTINITISNNQKCPRLKLTY
jgi:hypothetical protein